jgi:hypothetical protein
MALLLSIEPRHPSAGDVSSMLARAQMIGALDFFAHEGVDLGIRLHRITRLDLPPAELLALRIDARERLADPLLLLGDLEPVKSPEEPMVCGLSPGGDWIRTFSSVRRWALISGSPTSPAYLALWPRRRCWT